MSAGVGARGGTGLSGEASGVLTILDCGERDLIRAWGEPFLERDLSTWRLCSWGDLLSKASWYLWW